jgi:hypothetical protein
LKTDCKCIKVTCSCKRLLKNIFIRTWHRQI